jgi:hypothetical protein
VANPLVITGTTPTPPTLVLDDTATLSSGRVISDSSGNLLMMTNLRYDGSAWNADDVAKPGVAVIMQAVNGNLAVYQSPAGANPRTPNLTFLIQPDGAFRERGRTTPVGEWIDIPYNAANFTASGAMTWTVTSGGQYSFKYALVGKIVVLYFDIGASTVGGTPGTQLILKLPIGCNNVSQLGQYWLQNPTGAISMFSIIDAGRLALYRDATLGALWTLGTNNVRVAGTMIYPTY